MTSALIEATFASSSVSAGNCQYVSVKIDAPGAGAAIFHAYSAVKLRNGAIQRSIACAMCHSAVCALRRACEFGAVV